MENAYSIILIEKMTWNFINTLITAKLSIYQKCCKEIYQHYNGVMGLWIIFSSFFQHSFIIFIINVFLEMFTDFFFKRKGNTSKQVDISVRVLVEDRWHT